MTQERRYIDRESIGISARRRTRPANVWLALVVAFLIPVVGVIVGVVYLARGKVGPGLAVLLVSLIGFVLALALFGV